MVFPVESFDSIEELRPLQPTPSAKDLLEDLQQWLAGPALIPRITYPHYITLHPCHADSFLYLPTNTRVRVGTDSGDGPRYRPLWEVQQFLKRHKKHHRFWSILLQDLESMLRRTGNTYMWNITFLKGERLPFQVVHGEGGGCDLDGSSGRFYVAAVPNPLHPQGWRSFGRSRTSELVIRCLERNLDTVKKHCEALDWHRIYVANPREGNNVFVCCDVVILFTLHSPLLLG